jgi:hypothetical protein
MGFFFAILTILIFLIGSVWATIFFVLNAIQKRRLEKHNVRQWWRAVSDLFWGMG